MKKSVTILLLLMTIIFGIVAVTQLDYKVNENKKMFRLVDYSVMNEQEILSSNTMVCDLATFSNIVNGLLDDGYEIKKEINKKEKIDIIIVNEVQELRMIYTNKGDFVSLGNPYEKSYIPLTYINEGNARQPGYK